MWWVGRWPQRQRARTGRDGVGPEPFRDAMPPEEGDGGKACRGESVRTPPRWWTVEILGCALPEDRLYDLEHEVWWLDEPDGGALLGFMATLVAFAGKVDRLTFRPVEGAVARGRSVATVESVRFTGAVRLPVDATVVERNRELERRPRLLNDAPYTDGWVVRVRPHDPDEPRRRLGEASRIAAEVEERIRTRKIRCWPSFPDLEMYEIGLECSSVLSKLNEEIGRRSAGETILLVTDDPTSPIEMVRWSDQTGHTLLAHRGEANLHHFLVRKEPEPRPRRRA